MDIDIIEINPVRIKIASIIRNAILSGEVAAGSELSLTEVANRLGLSRTPVREAFQSLAAEGLITLRMNKGAIVKPIDEAFITDHFRIRRLLEGEAVYRAIKHGIDAKPLVELQDDAIKQNGHFDTTAYEEYNQTFHKYIWKSAHGPKLSSLLETFWNGPSYSKAVDDEEHRHWSIKEHGQIIRAIVKGDAEKGQAIMYRHIERSMDNILKSVPGR